MTTVSPAGRAGTSLFASSLLLGILLIAANLRAPITSLGPVLEQVQHYFYPSSASAGFLNALPLLMFACASPLAPWLTRRFGLEQALFVAQCLIAIGCLIRSSGTFTGLWGGTLLIGGGIATANVLIVPLVKRDFGAHAALCVGLYAATMAMMAALASGLPAPLSALTWYTWKVSLGVWFVLALIAIICGPFLAGWLHSVFGTWQVSLWMLLSAATLQMVFAEMAVATASLSKSLLLGEGALVALFCVVLAGEA